MAKTTPDYPYVWFWRTRMPERKGQRCKLLKVGGRNSVLIEFDDGYQVITDRRGLRKVKES